MSDHAQLIPHHSLDFDGRIVWVRGKPVRTSPIRARLLERLYQANGRIVTHESLEQAFYDGRPKRPAIRAHISLLRRDFADVLEIKCDFEIGYRLLLKEQEKCA